MKTYMKRWPAIFVTLFAVILLNACGKGGDDGYNNPGGGGNNNGGGTSSNSVSIKNMAFSSANLTIAKGTTVTWTNNDNMDHTVTADDGSFDSGTIAYGATYSKTFNDAGTYDYHCTLHANMTGKVVVQ